MAEFVNQTLEEMIPELEEMNQLDLFTVKETKIILKKREGHEYKLRQITKTKEAYINYIEYETKLLELLKFRRKKTAQDTRKRKVERAIADRIHKLFRLATTRFSDDVSLWERHIEFSKIMNEKATVSRLYEQVLKLHSRNEDLWVKAAQWESSEKGNQNPALARTLLLKGQRVNPQSESIFIQMFKMELDQAKKIIKRKKILGLETTKGKEEGSKGAKKAKNALGESALTLAEIVYRNGLEMFNDNPAVHLKLLSLVCDVREAQQLQDKMASDLKYAYPDVAQVWNALALRHLHRIDKFPSPAAKVAVIKKCVDSYEETLKNLSTDEMWSFALSGILNILKMKEATACQWILPKLLAMFEKAIQQRVLSEELCLQLLELLNGLDMHEDLAKVAIKSTQLHPSSSRLWLERLRIEAMQIDSLTDGDESAPDSMLKIALKTVPEEESWPLWEFVLNFMAALEAPCLEKLMEMACRSTCPMTCKPAKEWVLLWTFRNRGIKYARNVYKSLRHMRPISLDFFKIYLRIEASQVEPNVKSIRSVFEEALAEFGSTEPDVWLNYILMERELNTEDMGQTGTIYDRALQGLKEKLREGFIRKHVMLGMGEQ